VDRLLHHCEVDRSSAFNGSCLSMRNMYLNYNISSSVRTTNAGFVAAILSA
jgi:hypothetical protein